MLGWWDSLWGAIWEPGKRLNKHAWVVSITEHPTLCLPGRLILAWLRQNKHQAHFACCFIPRAVPGTWSTQYLVKKMDARCPEHEAAEGSASPAGRPLTLPVWAVYTWTFVFPFSFCVSILILALHHLNHDDLKVDLRSISCLFEKGLLGKFFCNWKFKKYSSSFPASHFYLQRLF